MSIGQFARSVVGMLVLTVIVAAPVSLSAGAQEKRPLPAVGGDTAPAPAPASALASGQEEEAEQRAVADGDEPDRPVVSIRGVKGVNVESSDGRYRMHIWLRGQFRMSYPFSGDPRSPGDFDDDPVTDLGFRRARIKIDGNAYQRWFGYYFEYDVVNGRLLDLRFTMTKLDWLQLRIGQWKVNYNRERVDSSGKQQFAERSIVNREFTVDRQAGVMATGRVAPGTLFDFRYFVGAFSGNGQGNPNDDDVPMLLGRLTWNIFGRDLGFAQSDIGRHEEVAATLSTATISNTSQYTRFSGAGGSQLDGVDPTPRDDTGGPTAPGAPGQYRVRQYLQEFALMYRGLSIQQEYHWKRIEDRVNGTTTRLQGLYAQAGYFFHGMIPAVPAPLELAVRYAWVDPDTEVAADDRREYSVAANWFFSSHDNKLTADVSRLTLDQPGAETLSDTRFRLQWDVSF